MRIIISFFTFKILYYETNNKQQTTIKVLVFICFSIVCAIGCFKSHLNTSEQVEEGLNVRLQQMRNTDYSFLTTSVIDLSSPSFQYVRSFEEYLTIKKVDFNKDFSRKIGESRMYGISLDDATRSDMKALDNILNEFEQTLIAKINNLIEEKSYKNQLYHTNNILEQDATNLAEKQNNDSLKQFVIDQYSNLQESIVTHSDIKQTEFKEVVMENIEVVKQNIDLYIGLSKNIESIDGDISGVGFWGKLTKWVKTTVTPLSNTL